MTSLVNHLDALPGETVLALDDYHVIDTPEIHEAMSFLHRTPAGDGERRDRLALGPAARRWRDCEAAASCSSCASPTSASPSTRPDVFLNRVMGLELSSDHVSTLDARTEGWAAGLQLAALSLRGHDDVSSFVEAFAGSHRFVLDYLVEEVLRRQPEHVRRFMLQTALLDQMTGPLCDALTGSADGQATLETLERNNLFIVPLDDERRWYRYHHLFADALRARLAAEQPDRMADLHGAASRWYADHELLEDAMAHAIAAGDPERAADLVELALPELRRRRQERTFRGWLEVLPDEVVRRRRDAVHGARVDATDRGRPRRASRATCRTPSGR